MAYVIYREGHSLALPAASAVNPYTPVQLAGTTVPFVLPVATNNVEPFGFVGEATAGASGLNQNEAVAIYESPCIVKAIAGASLGASADVAVASTNGALGPIARNAGSAVWTCGKALTAAAAGERFSLLVRPRLLGGLS